MYILDTDHISVLDSESSSPVAQRLRFRLARVEFNDRVTSIITFEEQMRGWLALLGKTSAISQQVATYDRLSRVLDFYRKIPVLSFDKAAADEYSRLRSARVRIGTMDLKIAAIALAHNATVLTRNLKDFSRVPDLRVEDWTAT